MNGPRRDWSVDILESGRCGKVIYRESAGSLEGYWEFGGGDTVASIHVGDEATWRQQHGWAVARRSEILRRIAGEVIRLRAPTCRADIDEPGGWINLRLGAATPVPPTIPGAAPIGRSPALQVSARKGRIVFFAALALLAGSLVVWGVRKAFMIRVPHGVPVGQSVRAPDAIATLIQTLEPYVPSLQGNAGKERYRLALFLRPVTGGSPGRMIPLAEHLTAREAHLAKLLGSDGRTVWFELADFGGVELATGRRIGPAELRAANPTLAESWDDPRRISFGRTLQVTLTDRTVREINPETLVATPLPRERMAAMPPGTPEVQDFLCAGVRPSSTEWLGLHSAEEAAGEYRPKSRLTLANHQPSAKVMRRLYRGELGPEQPRGIREILSLTPLSDDAYLDAAFLRAGPGLGPLALPEGAGHLMVFTSAPGLAGTLVVARVDARGKPVWKVDTGIDRFKWSQILPDPRIVAFVGTRPPVPNKVPEPILVTIDTQSGSPSTTTLWQ
jgi:hypothetical protein